MPLQIAEHTEYYQRFRYTFYLSRLHIERQTVQKHHHSKGLAMKLPSIAWGSQGKTFCIPVVTDIHTAEEAEMAAPYVDVLQIPAFPMSPDRSS
jgi:3-deoxy-D-manno-octulosonic acid (KDO) 8-phosphate synthase